MQNIFAIRMKTDTWFVILGLKYQFFNPLIKEL